MAYMTLIRPEELAPRLEAPDWRVFDCRFDLMDPGRGDREWREAHVPGAGRADLERHLSGPTSASTGRHPLPDPYHLAEWLGGEGVGAGTQVVAYDADSGAFAARLWWLLRWLGHDRVAVLDGGFAAWEAAGYPVEQGLPARPAAQRFPPRLREEELHVAADAIAAGDSRLLVVDARDPARFRGEREPIDPVAGHVPGAVNRPFPANLDGQTGRWLEPARLRQDWQQLIGTTPATQVAHMCGSGVTAAHNALAMEHAGLAGSRLYPGSWSEWITDPERPVATGREGA